MMDDIKIPYKKLAGVVHYEKSLVALTEDGDLFFFYKNKWRRFSDIPMNGAVRTINVSNGCLLISLGNGSIWVRKDKKWQGIEGIPEALGERLY